MSIENDKMRLDLLQDFGETATFTDTSAGSTSSITVILTNDYLAADPGGSVEVESSSPVAIARTIDVPNVAQGDTLLISSTTYTIREVEPDNQGMTTESLSDTIQDLGGSARLVSRSLSVRVEGYARATSNLDDTLDTISAEVETAVANSTSIDALLTDLELSSTEVSFTEGDREIGVITMDFGVIYTVASNDPQTAK
jgi:hypothetical protein